MYSCEICGRSLGLSDRPEAPHSFRMAIKVCTECYQASVCGEDPEPVKTDFVSAWGTYVGEGA